jgi:protein-tyrosine-phosphatase
MDEDVAKSADLPGAVLFACSQNAIRSPMAEALMKHYWGHKVFVDSCGVRAGERDEFIVPVLEEVGVDISRHVAKSFDDLLDSSFDLVITLSPEAHHRALEMTRTMAIEVEYWPTMDPSVITGSRDQIMDGYRACRDHLIRRMRERFGKTGLPTA